MSPVPAGHNPPRQIQSSPPTQQGHQSIPVVEPHLLPGPVELLPEGHKQFTQRVLRLPLQFLPSQDTRVGIRGFTSRLQQPSGEGHDGDLGLGSLVRQPNQGPVDLRIVLGSEMGKQFPAQPVACGLQGQITAVGPEVLPQILQIGRNVSPGDVQQGTHNRTLPPEGAFCGNSLQARQSSPPPQMMQDGLGTPHSAERVATGRHSRTRGTFQVWQSWTTQAASSSDSAPRNW